MCWWVSVGVLVAVSVYVSDGQLYILHFLVIFAYLVSDCHLRRDSH